MLDIFRVQAISQGVRLLFDVRGFLHSPVVQGERSLREIEEIFMQLNMGI